MKSNPDHQVDVGSSLECAVETLTARRLASCKLDDKTHYCDIITNTEKAVVVEMKGANQTHCTVTFKDG